MPLTDQYGRVHTYLRVSVTDRCNYRCVYCMPAEGMSWVPRKELLTYEEIARIVRVFAGLGIRQIRLTGGEPTMRSDITQLIATLRDIPGIDDLSMTTNAHTLARLAQPLVEAGLTRLNVSIDSLKPDRFAALTRGGDLKRVLDGIEAARAAGLTPIKLNAVLLAGENEDEIFDLVEYAAAADGDLQLRFIEYMPFEARWHRCVPAAEVRRRLATRYTLATTPDKIGGGPSREWRIAENGLRVGFISPLSHRFCDTCNRLRLMVDGHLRTCLAHEDTPSLRDLLRQGASETELADSIRLMVLGKPDGHHCEVDGGEVFQGVMTGIGG
ncbi:MAG: cyclic pyranopterin phosphate synthase [Myxococcota bacterium]|jgi:cyclic pyranopterin phosphate synthase